MQEDGCLPPHGVPVSFNDSFIKECARITRRGEGENSHSPRQSKSVIGFAGVDPFLEFGLLGGRVKDVFHT